MYIDDVAPTIEIFALNAILYNPDFDDYRREIISRLDKKGEKDEILKDVSAYIRAEVAPELFERYPYIYAKENKFPNCTFADLTYACKTLFHEHPDKCCDKLTKNLDLVYQLDELKSKINPQHRAKLRCKPTGNYVYDLDERESASADRCF